MSSHDKIQGVLLCDSTTGAVVGYLDRLGQEQMLPSSFNQSAVAITGGTINGTSIGTVTPSTVKTNNLMSTFNDTSGSPGNATNNNPRGKAAFGAGQNAIVINNSNVSASSAILCMLETADATLTQITRVVPSTGSFAVYGNASATAATTFSFLVIN